MKRPKEKEEKPIRVRRYKSEGHLLESRVFARDIYETFCAQPRCKFRGKYAAQGICHTKKGLAYPNKIIERAERLALLALREIKKMHRGKPKHLHRYLEGMFVANEMNNTFLIDDLVRLRAENARLKRRLGTYK